MTKAKQLWDAKALKRCLKRLSAEVTEQVDVSELALVGIHTRGVFLARRLKEMIDEQEGCSLPMGTLDINLYRDDLTDIGDHPEIHSTDILFDLADKKVVLVDDVLYTGRTIRAALNAMADLGRARQIKLLVLVDRGLRELPIQPDFAGMEVATTPSQAVHVHLKEHDKKDEVVLEPLKKGEMA